jgi:large subunit ribosomal protein L35
MNKKPNKNRKSKTRKAIIKRFKITKNGKVLRRQTGLDHYRRKKSGSFKRKKRKMTEMSKEEAKKIKKLSHF